LPTEVEVRRGGGNLLGRSLVAKKKEETIIWGAIIVRREAQFDKEGRALPRILFKRETL